jgi:hypothetical protein
MRYKTVKETPVYTKKPLDGQRTSEFVPNGKWIAPDVELDADSEETDHTGTFLKLGLKTSRSYVDKSSVAPIVVEVV